MKKIVDELFKRPITKEQSKDTGMAMVLLLLLTVLGGNATGKSLRKRLEMMSLPSGGALICGRAIQILRRAIAHCRK